MTASGAKAKFDLDSDGESDHTPVHSRSSSTQEPEPSTPTFRELKKNLSFASLRDIELKELQSVVWRNGKAGAEKGGKKRPKDIETTIAYAMTAGARSLLLGCCLRAGVNLVVVALRGKKGLKGHLIIQALFGQDTLRFGTMLGMSYRGSLPSNQRQSS